MGNNKTKISLLIILSVLLLSLSACSNNDDHEINATDSPSTEVETETDTNIAYTFDDGTTLTKDELLSPVRTYDNICSTGDASNFLKVYPAEVLDFCLEASSQETYEDYAQMLYNLYTQIYGENFQLTNTFVDCQPLTDHELEKFCQFYEKNMNLSIEPSYAFIITSEFNISYFDDDDSPMNDSDLDYYIAYFFNNNMYLDYFYIDTLDL